MRILMVSCSSLCKRSCTPPVSVRKFSDASPTADNIEVTSEKMYDKLLEIRETRETVAETLNQFINLIAMEKDTAAAEKYFNKLDDSSKNQATYRKLLRWYCREEKEDKAKALFKKMDHLNFLDSKTPFNI
ncbi:hypothetical protein Bca52824_016674 [Brassica carinata]|uniref:Uncharacterized protein n=1 Tax=Brassica carinata TaxID=52824 RepID=A0A8X7W4W9_BRACI|nr:hypothetical protein Bca52824_016674 [Brassica carinata]